jgi:hypothetical protein
MPDRILHHREHILVAAAFGIDQPFRTKPCPGQAGSEQIPPRQCPEHVAGAARDNAGDEQAGGCIVGQAGLRRRYFMQRGQRQPSALQPGIKCSETEGKVSAAFRSCISLDRAHCRAQCGQALAGDGIMG